MTMHEDSEMKELKARIEELEKKTRGEVRRRRREKCDWCYGRGGQMVTGHSVKSVWIECENCFGTGVVEYH